jgi:hypothetical protein
MKQIAECKRKDEGHRAIHRARNLENPQNGMAFDQSPTSMERQSAADDDIKFSDRAMSGFRPQPLKQTASRYPTKGMLQRQQYKRCR